MRSFGGFGAPHRPDRVPQPVLHHLLRNLVLKDQQLRMSERRTKQKHDKSKVDEAGGSSIAATHGLNLRSRGQKRAASREADDGSDSSRNNSTDDSIEDEDYRV